MIIRIISEKNGVRAALASSINSVNSAPERGKITFDSLSPGQIGFSYCKKSVSVGKSEVKRSSRGFEDEVDLFARLCGIHASQIKSRVARSGDTVDFEDIFRLAVEGFKASRDLYS